MHQSYWLCVRLRSRKLLLLVQLQGFDIAMGNKCLRLFFGLLFFEPGHIAVVLRCITDLFLEQGAEGAEAFKTYFVANFTHGFCIVVAEQFFGFFKPLVGNVLVRGTPVDMREQPVKMETREECLARHRFQIDAFMEIEIHEPLGAYNALVMVQGYFHAG